MTPKMFLLLALVACPVCAVAQPSTNRTWIGIWNAHVNGQPTATLTLAADTGRLGGTVVLDMVSNEGGTPHVIASEPHVLINPRIHNNSLAFEVRMKRPDGALPNRELIVVSFIVTRTPDGKAHIHCVTCGPNAPIVELSRE